MSLEDEYDPVDGAIPDTVDIIANLADKMDFAIDSPNWLIAIVCTKGKEVNSTLMASHMGLPERDYLFERLGFDIFNFYGDKAEEMVERIQDGINQVKKELEDAGVTE